MNILISSNDNYFFPAKIMLESLFANNSGEHINVYYLYNNTSRINVRLLKSHVWKKGGSFFPYKVNEKDFACFPISHHFSIETYYRFLAAEIIPEAEDRVLWLDVDMIVKKDITDFYHQDFEGKLLVVCKSINTNPEQLLTKLGCPDGTVYFNAGMILFNLQDIRKCVSVRDYYLYFESHKDRITWLDQDILNGVYALKTKIADTKTYNCQMFNNTVFSDADLSFIETDTAILHYIGKLKPWDQKYTNPCKKYFDRYADPYRSSEKARRFLFDCLELKHVKSFYGFIVGKLQNAKKEKAFKKAANQALQSNSLFLLGTPAHKNIGDSAIVLAERSFLKKIFLNKRPVQEYTKNNLSNAKYKAILARLVGKKNDCLIFYHGGGNMGDQWLKEEQFRRDLLTDFSARSAFLFPQTVYYTDTETGKAERQKSIGCYNGKDNLVLTAREKTSYTIMRELYPGTKCLLTPDIVLSTTLEDYDTTETERHGVLLCARSDKEKMTDDSLWEALDGWLTQEGNTTQYTDMYSDIPVTKENRRTVVSKKMQEFRSAELVITDRLHGMVFSAIAGTPCVVFGNCNHKVKETFDWISYLPYVRYVESLDEAKEAIKELQNLPDCKFTNEPLLPYFKNLSDEIIRVSNDISNRSGL